ncbi:MAG: TetR/AcrR family transcriptional regulator [Oscillospiraceae bacterium]
MAHLLNKPRTERGMATLNNILSAAAQVFFEKGYYGANVNEIAKLAGVATGTVYIYFDGKYNLYKYLLLQCSHQIRKHLSLATKDCKTRREAERVGLHSWLEFTLQNQYMYNIIWESLYVDRQLFREYYDAFCQSYVKGLENAKLKGEVREIDSTVLSYVLMGATSFLGLHWGVFHDGKADLDYVVNEFMKILDGGMFTSLPMMPMGEIPKAQAPAGNMMFHVEVDEDFFEDLYGKEGQKKSGPSSDEK